MKRPALKHNLYAVQWLFLALALVLLGSVAGYALYEEHQRIREREEGWLLAMSRVMQLNIEQNLISINQVLADLARELQAGKTGDDLEQRLRTLAGALPSTLSIHVHDGEGTIRFASQPALINNTRHFSPYEQIRSAYARQSPEALFVSAPLHAADGVLTVSVARVIPAGEGGLSGAVVAHLDPDYFEPMLNSVRYAPNMAAFVHHGNGTIFMMYPHDRDELIGKDLMQGDSLFARHRASGQSATVSTGRLQAADAERMIAQRDIQPFELKMNQPLRVSISRPVADIYALWRHDIALASGLFGIIVLTLGAGLYAYQRRLRQFLAKEALARQALSASEWKLRAIIEAEPEGVMLMAADGTLLQINQAGLALLECDSEGPAIGTPMSRYLAPEYAAAFAEINARVVHGEAGTLEYEIIGNRGTRRWVDSHVAPLRDADGNTTSVLAVTRDTTERKKVQQELERLAQTDTLTGLANRRHFMQQAEQELSRASRYGSMLSLLMIDIDRFKDINDSHGHQVGDRVLQKIGGLCRETLRDVDCVGRIGGEEFAVLLPQTDGTQALDVAERLRVTVARAAVTLADGKALHFSISVGLTTLSGQPSVDALLGQADKAMYEAKRSGRNKVCVYAPEPSADATPRHPPDCVDAPQESIRPPAR